MRPFVRALAAGVLAAAAALAQISSFPKPSYFRETFQRTRTKVELRDPVRLKDFVVDGKLELSLKNYLALVMANNTDIQLEALSVEVPKNAIETALGAWDPKATMSYSETQSAYLPLTATSAQNVNAVAKSVNEPYSMGYTQTLPEGLQYTAQFLGARTYSTNSFSIYNPAVTANMRVSVTQPLLQNRGAFVNRLPLLAAQMNYKASKDQERQQLLTLINTAETAYWNVVAARENLKVAEAGRTNADEFLKYMQKQLDLGALSPLDIYNPQQSLAAADLTVSQAKFNLLQAEDALRHQMGADLDPEVRTLPISLTEPVDLGPAESIGIDREQKIQTALMNHPAVRQALEKMDVDDFGIQSAKNGLLPNLSLSLSYQTTGTGGIYFPGSNLFGGTAGVPIVGGISDALNQMFGLGYPTYAASLTLTLPVRNRAASAAMANALVQKKTDALNLRNTEQAIRLNILTAVNRLDGAEEQLNLAKVQLGFAQKNLDAENTKFQLGSEINQNVINAQQVLVQAESAVVTNQVGVRLNLLNLLTQTGELLEERGIVVK